MDILSKLLYAVYKRYIENVFYEFSHIGKSLFYVTPNVYRQSKMKGRLFQWANL